MLKIKSARPAKAGTSNLVKAETSKETHGGDQYFSRAVGKALEVLEFLQSELKPLSMNEIASGFNSQRHRHSGFCVRWKPLVA